MGHGRASDLKFGVAPPGFRLPAATRIGRVTLRIADLERSLAYYRDVVGFRLIRRSESGDDTWAELGALGSDEVWLELHQRRGIRPVPRRGLIGLYHFALLLPDRPSLGCFLRHITAAGLVPGAADHLVSEALYLTDPDGIVMEVYRDRPRDEWRVAGRELAMVSDPLDREGLLAAGVDPWAGVPSGSCVGHMHFYVEDLRGAEAFYHAALGFDKTGWSFPGALFLSAGGYHHHVGTNTWAAGAPITSANDAGLESWELVLPDQSAVKDAMRSLEGGGFTTRAIDRGIAVADPWGITAQITVR